MARSNLNLRRTSLRWTLQLPSKVATLSQIAAPHRDDQVGGKIASTDQRGKMQGREERRVARSGERGKRQEGRGEEEGGGRRRKVCDRSALFKTRTQRRRVGKNVAAA